MPAGHMQDTCRTHAGHMQDTCRTHTGHIQDTYRTHTGHIQDTYRTGGHVCNILYGLAVLSAVYRTVTWKHTGQVQNGSTSVAQPQEKPFRSLHCHAVFIYVNSTAFYVRFKSYLPCIGGLEYSITTSIWLSPQHHDCWRVALAFK